MADEEQLRIRGGNDGGAGAGAAGHGLPVAPFVHPHPQVFSLTMRTNSVLIRSGKYLACSNWGPKVSRSRMEGSSQNTTQWGLPTLAQVML